MSGKSNNKKTKVNTEEKNSKAGKHKKKAVKEKLTLKTVIGRIFQVLGFTLLLTLIFLITVIFVLLKGPSEQARKLFTLSCYETSACKWVPRIFLSATEYDAIINPVLEVDDYRELPRATVTATDDTSESEDGFIETVQDTIEIIDIRGATYQGKLMIVRDPSKVFFASLDSFGGVGLTLSQFLDKYDAVGCTNAGGFVDEGGTGKGGVPDGIVIQDGRITYGSAGGTYRGLAGFDSSNVLHVGDMTGQQALDLGIINGTNFSGGPVLIKDGQRMTGFVSGINPRTCIGQTADGTVLLLAIEGRMADSLGATFEDLTDIMEEYGAVNAVNMDGGSSSGMYYQGERITRSCSVIGDRPVPTAIMVIE